jgi:hypothetical protein
MPATGHAGTNNAGRSGGGPGEPDRTGDAEGSNATAQHAPADKAEQTTKTAQANPSFPERGADRVTRATEDCTGLIIPSGSVSGT